MAISCASFLQRSLRKAAQCCGARAPATMARMRRGPVAPVISRSACDNWLCICNSACCMWRTWGARCSRSWARWRNSVRSATRSAAGRHEAARFPFLTQRNPRDARGCHSDRLDATVHKPIGQRLEIHGVGTKGAHDLLIIAVGHTSHDLMRANVDARSVWVNLAHALERTGFALRGSSTIAFTQFAHGILLRRTHE